MDSSEYGAPLKLIGKGIITTLINLQKNNNQYELEIIQMLEDMQSENQEDSISLSLADINEILDYNRKINIQSNEQTGEDLVNKALHLITEKINNKKQIKAILILFVLNNNYPLIQINNTINNIITSINKNATIIWGTSVNNSFKLNQIKVTVLSSS